MNNGRLDKFQQLVSDFVAENSPVEYRELQDYLKGQGAPEKEIHRVLIEELVEYPLDYGSLPTALNPFYHKRRPQINVKLKVLKYDTRIKVREATLPGITGLKEPRPPTPGLIPPSPLGAHECILPDPGTVVPMVSREYYFCP